MFFYLQADIQMTEKQKEKKKKDEEETGEGEEKRKEIQSKQEKKNKNIQQIDKKRNMDETGKVSINHIATFSRFSFLITLFPMRAEKTKHKDDNNSQRLLEDNSL